MNNEENNFKIRVTLDSSNIDRDLKQTEDKVIRSSNRIRVEQGRFISGSKAAINDYGSHITTTMDRSGLAGLNALKNYIGPVALSAMGLAAGKAFYDSFQQSIERASKLQSLVQNSLSIKPQLDARQFYKDLSELQTRVPKTAQEMAEAAYDIFSSIEVTQAEALKLVEKFSQGATAAVSDTKTWAAAVMGVLNAYKLTVEDVDHVQDVFFNTIKAGVVNGSELASSLGVVTQAAKNAGVGLDEMGALIAAVTKEGGNASQNINNLANTLQKLPTKETQKALDALKVSTIDLKTGGFRPILDVLKDLDEKLRAMSQADRAKWLQAIFPDAQARTGLQTILSQLQFVEEQLKVNQTEAGSAGQAYKTMSETYEVSAKLQENAMHRLQETIGQLIITHPAYIEAMKITTEQVNVLTDSTVTAGSETQKFADDSIRTWSKIKANIIPFTGFLTNMVQLVANSLGIILGSVTVAVTKMNEMVINGVKNAVQGAINFVIDGINKVVGIANSMGPVGAGALGISGLVGTAKLERYNSPDVDLTSNMMSTLKETQSAIGANYRAMKAFATEGGTARDRIDRAIDAYNTPEARAERARMAEERKRLDEERIARTRQLQAEAEERLKKLGTNGTSGGSGVPDPDGSNRRGRARTERVVDEESRFRLSEFKGINEAFKQLTGRDLPTSAYGQGKIHNKRGWDHTNAVDVSLNPNSEQGKVLIQLLKQMGVPHIASTGKEAWSTGAHIHVGEASRAFGKNTRSLAVNRDQDNLTYIRDAQGNVIPIDRVMLGNRMADLRERMPKQPVEVGATQLGVSLTRKLNLDEQYRLPREEEQSRRLTDSIMRERNLASEIRDVWREVYDERKNLHMDTLVDIERTEQRLSMKVQENASAEVIAARRTLQVRREQEDLYDRLTAAQDRMAMATENTALRMQVAYTEAYEEIQQRSVDAYERMARAAAELEDQTVFHSEQMHAAVLDHAASAKSVTEIWSDAYIGAMDAVGDGVSRVLGKLTDKMGVFGDIINDIASNLTRLVTNRLMVKLLDAITGNRQSGVGGIGTNAGASAGGVLSAGGNLLQGWLNRGVTGGSVAASGVGLSLPGGFAGGGGANQFLTGVTGGFFRPDQYYGSFSRSLTSQQAQQITQQEIIAGAIQQSNSATGGVASSGAAGAAGAVGGLTASVAATLPFLGFGLGSSLGGSSTTGSILGGVGGAVLGAAGGVALLGGAGAGIFATGGALSSLGGAAALLSNPFTIAAGAALLVGGLLLGRNKRRRQEEQIRDQFHRSARDQIYELLRQAKAGEIDLTEARAAFEQIKKTYLDQANALKDSKTRRIAVQTWEHLQPLWQQIEAAAVGVKDKRAAAERLRPEFDTGGVVPGALGTRQHIVAHAGEIIINQSQQTPAVMSALNAAGVPNVRGAVAMPTSLPSGLGGSSSGAVSVTIIMGKQDQTEILVNGLRSDKGKVELGRAFTNLRRDNEL